MIFSDEDLVEPVQNILSQQMYILERDGGSMNFLGVKNGVVYIQLIGACHGCAASSTTLKYGLERALRANICNEIRLQNLEGGMSEFESLS